MNVDNKCVASKQKKKRKNKEQGTDEADAQPTPSAQRFTAFTRLRESQRENKQVTSPDGRLMASVPHLSLDFCWTE